MTYRHAAFGLFLALCAVPSWAMYRCGNVFQDRPCDAGVPEQRLGPGGQVPAAPKPAAASPGAAGSTRFAAACARVGERAQAMTWRREAGATLEKQIAELPNDGNRAENTALLQSVYARRGSAPEIRSAIEAECVVERQKQAEAAELLKALQQQAGQTAPASRAAEAPTASEADNAPKAQPVANRPPSNKGLCDSLRSQKDSAEAALRRGGSAATMESHQNQRRSIEQSMSQARC
jgi:hypothetical protein